jgi:hypothetical protein
MDDYYLVEAKQEYTSYLISTLAPSMFTGIRDIFEQSKKIINGNSVFKNFQILLSNVPKWNNYILEKEVSDITKETGCDWLDNLITAVFVSHSKILTSVKVGNYRPKNRKIDLKIPDTVSFIHQCYVEAAREFYKNPMLFLDDTKIIRPDEILKNTILAHAIIKESILNTIRKLLPFRNILTEYLALDTGNTIYIGNTTVGSTAHIPKTIEGAPIILPPIQEESVSSKIIEELPLQKASNQDLPQTLSEVKKALEVAEKVFAFTEAKVLAEADSLSDEEEEKEVAFNGKELDLNDLNIDTSVDMNSLDLDKSIENTRVSPKEQSVAQSVAQRVAQKADQSFDSITVQQMVNTINDEYNSNTNNKPIESSIDLDDLSFLNTKKSINPIKQIRDNDNFNLDDISLGSLKDTTPTKLTGKSVDIANFNLDDLSVESLRPSSIRQASIKSTRTVKADKSESIDLDKIKQVLQDDGTIQDNKMPNKLSFLDNIQLPQKVDHKEKSLYRKQIPQQIKKISIKYNSSGPFNTKRTIKKKKTTLLDIAADDDSSEMIFK